MTDPRRRAGGLAARRRGERPAGDPTDGEVMGTIVRRVLILAAPFLIKRFRDRRRARG